MSDYLKTVTEAVKAHPFAALALTHALTSSLFVYSVSEGRPLQWIVKKLFQSVLSVVPASVMDAEQDKLRKSIEKSVIGHSLDGETLYAELPAEGMSKDEIVSILDRYGAHDSKRWKNGHVSGTVYHGGEDLTDIMTEAFRRFALSNPLHPDVFPYVRKMESEVVAMTLRLFHASDKGCGTMTSGGTESILMAMKAYRDYAKSTRGVREPEIVVPETAHAAFDKACGYFGIKLVHIPVDQTTFRVDPAAMERAITRNTVAMVCSAPCYPQGVIDPVEAVGAIARKHNIPLHVDCCLGSYLIACAEAAGFPKPLFDFRVPGVTSISVDTHKYGYAPKGSSVVLYSKPEYRHAQYFTAPNWTGGIYASPSIAGSRPGALIVACWATLMRIGYKGYVDAAKVILTAAKDIAAGIEALPGSDIKLFGQPELSIVCFGTTPSSKLSIYHINDALSSRGWNLNVLQNPACIHVCLTYANAETARARFVKDLADAIEEVRTAPKGKFKDGSAAMYGMAASIPDKSLISQVSYSFLDALYKAGPPSE